ncbi:glycosyltransferase family 4 protein [Arthrobacter sp. FW306-06-A]|uniref:glycosyltransferase family 4 protein n=1 Tax=Arthrobacter sp. FW306-06-A TaxID=2879621 RepID=UPI001F28C0DD|nr:glycosyltransferase family 4 protein [Arthrobacter sp. FW306-06-A]UKA71151.1 glycosyltransferase family 4 protein [Arthrobacter sp. FW306-06-A]
MSNSKEAATSDPKLIPASLILVAPRVNSGGVGDYAQELIAAAIPSFCCFREIRTGGPGDAGILDLVRYRAQLAEVIDKAASDGPVVVHFELSAASLAPFWLLAGCPRHVVITATVHDPPWAVWWPFRFKSVAARKWLHHGIHLPLRPVSKQFERLALRGTALFALTDVGARALREAFPACTAVAARHFIPSRAALKPAFDRPLAVGLYGHAAKGKGFERLVELRAALPPEVDVIVAGRGTEKLPHVPGVTILGAVEGAEEDAFFESVRAILLPYDKTSRFYGKMLPASGVVSRAFAYGTPVLGFDSGTLGEASKVGGLIAVPNSVQALADAASMVITDQAELERLESEIGELQKEHSVRQAVLPFVSFWRDAVDALPPGREPLP